ncbi:MAG TPA: hypothetical protein DD723_00770 [Candidatus Omnitrophica bacterium]|nr:hypothetical protein [Candidatus Omnitrophota bacterium]
MGEKGVALKKSLKFITFFLLGFLVCAGAFVYFICTEKGSQVVVRYFLEHAFKNLDISFKGMKGHLNVGFKLEDLEVKNLTKLPPGSVIRIQEFGLMNPVWDLQKINLVLGNGRVILPNADPIILEGNCTEAELNFSLYTKSFNVTELFNALEIGRLAAGNIENIDMRISGSLREPVVVGNFDIEKLIYQDVSLTNSPAAINLKFQNHPGGYTPSGTIILEGGKLVAKNTEINLQKSTFFITNDIKNPSFSIQGNSKIEDMDIRISLSGTKDNPEIMLKSDAALPTERLFLMLATGKSWKGLDASLDKKQISPDLVKDFIDYFVFSGSGDKLANELGIKNVFLTLEKDKKGIGIKKKVMNNLDVGYEINETRGSPQQKTKQQKMSGDVKVSNKVSVSVEKEIRPKDETQQSEQDTPTDGNVLLKYKTKF